MLLLQTVISQCYVWNMQQVFNSGIIFTENGTIPSVHVQVFVSIDNQLPATNYVLID